jgi:hypothetical protein
MALAKTTNPKTMGPVGCANCPPPFGTRECHCRGCLQHFSTEGNFDRHRQKGKCLDPAKVGLLLKQRRANARVWVLPDERI